MTERLSALDASFLHMETLPNHMHVAGLAILDAMSLNRCDIATFAVGLCASMGGILLSAGTPGKRYAMPNATIHMHQANVGGIQGQASDIEIEARETLRVNDLIRNILAKNTGQDPERIRHDFDRNFWMDAVQARDYGMVDEILQSAAAPVTV